MSINPISSGITELLNTEPVKNATESLGDGSFADIFTEAFNTTAETDAQDKFSSLKLLSGQADDMSGLLLDAQKAEISLNLALQLRNKALDAYDKIITMQV